MSDEQKPPVEDDRSSKQIASDVMNEVKGVKPPEQKPPEQESPEQKPVNLQETPDVPAELFGEKSEKPKAGDDQKPPKIEDEPPELKKADERTQEAFRRLRTELNQANERLGKSQQSQPVQRSTEQIAQEVTESKKQVDEMNAKLNKAYDELGKYSLSADPRFQAQYDGPQKLVVDAIKAIAKDWEVADDVVDSLLKASPKHRFEIIQESAPDMATMISGHLAQYDQYENMKKMAIEKHQETRKTLEEQHSQRATAMNQNARESLFKAASAKAIRDGHFLFTPIEGNEVWNKNVSVLHRKVSELFSGDNQMDQAEHLVLGVLAPVYLNLYKKERSRRMDIEKDMKARYKAKSGLNADPTDDGTQQQAPKNGVESKDVVASILKEELAR